MKQKYSTVNPPDETGGGGVGDGAGDVHAGAALGEDVGGAVYPRHRDCNGNTMCVVTIGVSVHICPLYISMPLFSWILPYFAHLPMAT